MRKSTLFLLMLFLPLACGAREVVLSGSATIGPSQRPAVNLDVTLLDPPGLPGSHVKTDQSGRFEMRLDLPEGRSLTTTNMVLRLEGRGVHAMNIIYQNCDLTNSNRCDEEAINLPLLTAKEAPDSPGLSGIPRIPHGEYGLILSPYEILPPNKPVQIDTRLFASTMRRAINSHLNELGAKPDMQDFGRLPLVDILTIDEPLGSVSFHRRRIIGEESGAIAVIGGLGEWKNREGQEQISLTTDFLLMPPAPSDSPLMIEIRDPGLPVEQFASLELASKLSPLWKRYSLIALAKWELNRARQSGDQAAVERIYAYVVEERSRLSGEEQARAAELKRLLTHIEEARQP